MASSHCDDDNVEYLVSPRYRNRLTFQALEAESIVKNLPINRQAAYGINWALRPVQNASTFMLSPRISNRLDELEKRIQHDLTRKAVGKVFPDDDPSTYNEGKGVVAAKPGSDADFWSEKWPEEWSGDQPGPVPVAVSTLPESVALVSNIEQWLISHESDGPETMTNGHHDEDGQQDDYQPGEEAVHVQGENEETVRQFENSRVLSDLEEESAGDDTSDSDRENKAEVRHRPKQRTPRFALLDQVPCYRRRLLASPLLYTPAGFGQLAHKTITLPRVKSSAVASPAKTTRHVVNDEDDGDDDDIDVAQTGRSLRRQKRRRRRGRKKGSKVMPLRSLSAIAISKHLPRVNSGNSQRNRRVSVVPAHHRQVSSTGGSGGGVFATIARGNLNFIIPEVTVPSRKHHRSESKLTALERYRIKMSHKKKLREQSEAFIEELEKQLAKGENKAKEFNLFEEPFFKKHFMSHHQAAVMSKLNGDAQRFLYSENKIKGRANHIEQRRVARDVRKAVRRVDEHLQREREYWELREMEFILNAEKFDMNEALVATRWRIQQHDKNVETQQKSRSQKLNGVIDIECETCARRWDLRDSRTRPKCTDVSCPNNNDDDGSAVDDEAPGSFVLPPI
ncbi:Uncharacterized protein PBTT_00835 [Plasmodiophora brassicae]